MPTVFNSALSDPSIKTLNLSGTVSLDEVTSVDRPITINGGKMEFSQTGQNLVLLKGGTVSGTTIENTSDSPETWSSTYGAQVYTGEATFDNCTFVGGNAGLLVNGSTVTLTGTTTVRGAGFGGIEVSKGAGSSLTPSTLNIEGPLVNPNESYGKPTVWVDGTTEEVGKVNDTLGQLTMVVVKNQNQYYLNPDNAVDPSAKESSEES